MKLRTIWALMVLLAGLLVLGGCASETENFVCGVIGLEEQASVEPAARDAVDACHPWNGCDLRAARLEVLSVETLPGIPVDGADRPTSRVILYGRLTSLELTRADTSTGFAAIDPVTAPVVLTLEQEESGECRVLEYWEAEAGSDDEAEIRERFPREIQEQAGRLCTAEAYTLAAERACLDEAVRLWDLDAGGMADRLLDSLMEAYPEGMDPMEFLSAHRETWRELQVLGLHTVCSVFSRFLAGDSQKTAWTVLAAVGSEMTMMIDDYIDEGPIYLESWFESFSRDARFYLKQDGKKELRDRHPCMWLALEMAGEA